MTYPSLLRQLGTAIAIPCLIVIAANVLSLALTDRVSRLSELWDPGWTVFAFQVALFSLPFLALTLAGTARRRYWVTAAGLTAAFWGFFVHTVWRASLNDFAGGANIGLGLLMMVAPALIMLVLAGMAGLRRRART